jgi:signal transduction histidine kinase
VRTWHDADRDAVVLEVNDDGPGVPEEVRPRIFDPFFTTKEVGKGTGQGLAIATSIVDRHGGSLTLDGGPATSFAIRLPIG